MNVATLKNQPIFANNLVQKLLKFLAFMLCWVGSAMIFYKLFENKSYQPTQVFSVCIIEDNRPTRIYLREFNHQVLCQNPVKHISYGNEAFYFDLEKIAQISPTLSEWELSEVADSPSDPIVSRYQVNSAMQPAKIIPLWEAKGGWTTAFVAWVFGLILSIIPYKISKKIWLKIWQRS